MPTAHLLGDQNNRPSLGSLAMRLVRFDGEIRVFMILFGISFATTALVAPRLVRAMSEEGVRVPSAAAVIPTVVLTGIAAAVGTRLGPGVGLRAPFFEAVVGGEGVVPALVEQLRAGIIFGAVATAGALVLYYGVFRIRLDVADVLRMERARLRLGVVTRVLQGGIVEEVIFRWGCMTTLAWLGGLMLGGASAAAMWSGIVLAGLVFGLSHLPGASVLGMRRSPALVGTAVVVNMWGGIVFGWLFWQYGLLAAMVAHGAVHAMWIPFDHLSYRRLAARSQAASHH